MTLKFYTGNAFLSLIGNCYHGVINVFFLGGGRTKFRRLEKILTKILRVSSSLIVFFTVSFQKSPLLLFSKLVDTFPSCLNIHFRNFKSNFLSPAVAHIL